MSSKADTETLPRAVYREAWRRDDLELEREAIGFWRRLGLLPPGPGRAPEARAKELVCAAYIAREVTADSTATIEPLPFLRARAALYRSATAPAHRRRWLVAQTAAESLSILERWAMAHRETGVKGMGIVLENPFLPQVKQLHWFQKARLDLPGRNR